MFDNTKQSILQRIVSAQNQEGSILLMTLLVLSAIVTATGAISIITIQSIKQTSLVDNGIRAFYGAESGIEQELYEIRKKETPITSIATDSGALSNGANWDITVSGTVESLTQDIAQNTVWQLDLYDPDSSISQLSTTIQSIAIGWNHEEAGGSEWLEVTVVPWNAGTAILGTPTTYLFSAVSASPTINFSVADVQRIRIKALYADVPDVVIQAYDQTNGGGTQVDLPAYVTMYSTGTYSNANQVIRATMPQRTPLSGVFNFVLFAEEDVYK